MSGQPVIVRRVRVKIPHHRLAEAAAIGRAMAEAIADARPLAAPDAPLAVPDAGPPSLLAASATRGLRP